MTRRARIAILAVALPVAIAIHVYMVWLGGGWRLFALIEGVAGVWMALLVRDAKRAAKS